MSDGVWRGVFLASAIFNFLVGISLAFESSALAASMGLEVARYDAFWSPLAAWFVILFGVFYLVIWRGLNNRAIAFVGMVGKLGVVALVALAYARGLVPFAMVGLTLIDLAFAVLFGLFLFTRRSAA
jgi:hypothetical protein